MNTKENVLSYKGYHTVVSFCYADGVLRGKIEGINDYVDFEETSCDKVEEAFHQAVDDYLAFCQDVGKEPDKEYSGTFNVRIRPEIHRECALLASKQGESLNCLVERAIERYVDGQKAPSEGAYQNSIKFPILAGAREYSSGKSNTQVYNAEWLQSSGR